MQISVLKDPYHEIEVVNACCSVSHLPAIASASSSSVTPSAIELLDTDESLDYPNSSDSIIPTCTSQPISQSKAAIFPVERRPMMRPLTTALSDVINDWFEASGISLGDKADTPDKVLRAKRVFYTWKNCFASHMRDVKPIDLIEHAIDLFPNAVPCIGKARRYTKKERDFAAIIFPGMEEAGIVVRGSSPWGAVILFSPKKKGSDLMRVVHSFIPINAATIKPVYPMHNMEEVLETLIKTSFTVFFSSDATNSYWAVPIRPGDEYKSAILAPNGQWLFKRMGQGLKGAPHTYSQFTDLVFGPLPKTDKCEAFPTLIKDHGHVGFAPFIDDHIGAADSFDALLDFLYEKYFPRVAFGPLSLSPQKTNFFFSAIDVLGFSTTSEGLRAYSKHRNRVALWPTPRSRQEVEDFIWLTPFLRIFIPGRADHVLKLKKAYITRAPIELKSGKPSVRQAWVEKEFEWGPEQDISFRYIKDSIANNAMAGSDPEKQYHLCCDASETGIGGILFQLHDKPPGTEATGTIKDKIRILLFLSFKLSDVETRYTTTEREALAVVRCLAEVRWIVMGSKWPTKIYTDDTALISNLTKGPDSHGKISRWLDRLTEYDFEVHHRPGKSNLVSIADGLSRLPGNMQDEPIRIDTERLALPVIPQPQLEPYISDHLLSGGDQIHADEQIHTSLPFAGLPSNDHSMHLPEIQGHFGELKEHPVYNSIIDFLLKGDDGIKQYDRSMRKLIENRLLRYRFADKHLMYIERSSGSRPAKCILDHEISDILKWAHDIHGHYTAALTLHNLQGQFFWPTRSRDVDFYVRSCPVCQRMGARHRSAGINPIIRFQPWSLVGMDFYGPIKPLSDLGYAYILVVVCYFTKMVFLHPSANADSDAVTDFWVNYLAPIFGWPTAIYTDNGSYFVSHKVTTLFESHGTDVCTAPISHPQSVGLAERMVQMVGSQLRKWAIEKGPNAIQFWGHAIGEIALCINTRLVRTHGFSPADMMLGYFPTWCRKPTPRDYDTGTDRERDVQSYPEQLAAVPGEHWSFLWEARNELRDMVAASIAHAHAKVRSHNNPLWTTPKINDLVLVRHHQLDKNKGKKLESRWLGPRLVVSKPSEVSARVANIYGDGKVKKYHIDDLKVYVPRSIQTELEKFPVGNDDYEINIAQLDFDPSSMKYASFPGSRYIDLNYPWMF
ncbi:hypothetical protein B7494_g8120 [Chlorociboria aeruginascens]|nr:hypothetical protein B7494_g8120 [Chlorociboria aeruginascens]